MLNNKIITVAFAIISLVLLFIIGKEFYGPYEPKEFLAFVFFGCVGFGMSLQHSVNKRDVISSEKPKHFSYRYAFVDNIYRIINALLGIIIAIRFMPEMLNNVQSALYALAMGFGIDRLPAIIKLISDYVWNLVTKAFSKQ